MKKHVLICGLGILLGFLLNTGVLAAANSSIGRWTIWSKNPALQWEDAFVTGNGKIGSLIAGRPQEERITCVHEELFIRGWDRHKVTVPQTAQLMPYVRQLMEKGKSDEAAWLLTDEAERQLHAMGANQRWPLIPHPAFDLCIRQLDKLPLPVADYRRQLNLETGEATVVWKQGAGSFTESVFSSRKDNVNVIRLKASNKGKINVELSLEETPGREGEHFEHDLDHAFSEVNREASGHWLTYHAAYDKDPGGYDGVAKVTLRGGNIQTKGKSLVVRNAEEVLIIVSIVSQEDARNASLDAVKAGLDKLAAAPMQLQVAVFKEQVELSEKYELPLIIHCVKAMDELLALRKERAPKQPWIWHGFRGKPEQAKQLLQKGFYLSFGMHYSSEAMNVVPDSRLFLETDDSPVDIEDVLRDAAKVRGVEVETLQAIVRKNIQDIFFRA